MRHVEDSSAALVLTSPPYFPPSLEPELRRPFREQVNIEATERTVTALALSLQPVFHEISRVLRPEGHLIVQSKDLRYGGFLIGPLDTHRRLAELAGFRLLTDIGWQPTQPGLVKERTRQRLWKMGQFVTTETERFLVFTREPLARLSTSEPEIPAGYDDPTWQLPAQGVRRTHPHESPVSVLRRLVAVYTQPGDLVVDPFCGHGTSVLVAIEQGRSGVGYDIDAACVDAATQRLERATGGRKHHRASAERADA